LYRVGDHCTGLGIVVQFYGSLYIQVEGSLYRFRDQVRVFPQFQARKIPSKKFQARKIPSKSIPPIPRKKNFK